MAKDIGWTGEHLSIMYNEQQSVFARFSGFFLFLIALGVVGVLVFLTVRSAQDDSGDAGLVATVSEEEGEVESAADEPAVEDETPAEEQPADEEPAAPANDDEGVVVADDDTGEPVTDVNDETVANADDTQDENTNDEQANDNEGNDDDTQEVAGAQDDNNETLPNTGPGEVALTVFAVSLLGVLAYNYRQSKTAINSSLLRR